LDAVHVRPANLQDRLPLARLRHGLWPDGPVEEHLREIDVAFATGKIGGKPMIVFVSAEGSQLTGFIEVDLRSIAEGCDRERPVGYIEGWFVREEFRNRGIGAALVRAAEDWARVQGCREMASDAQIDNVPSQRAHAALGYEAVERAVHFRKGL
jgi:aminoglycoside 6'-N-acetyltransferase I